MSRPTDRVTRGARSLLQVFHRFSLTARLMLISGAVLTLGGGGLLGALTARDAVALQAALQSRAQDEVDALAPLIADQAVIGDYAVIQQIFAARIRAKPVRAIEWVDRRGAKVQSADPPGVVPDESVPAGGGRGAVRGVESQNSRVRRRG